MQEARFSPCNQPDFLSGILAKDGRLVATQTQLQEVVALLCDFYHAPREQRKKKEEDKEVNMAIDMAKIFLKEDLIKDKNMVERYSAYLNKFLFTNVDPYIAHKHGLFVSKKSPGKKADFFQRMEQDRQRRVKTKSDKQLS